jgi:hypothetical protein
VTYDAWKLATPPEYEFLGPDPEEQDAEPRCDCGRLFEVCDAPKCWRYDDEIVSS